MSWPAMRANAPPFIHDFTFRRCIDSNGCHIPLQTRGHRARVPTRTRKDRDQLYSEPELKLAVAHYDSTRVL